MNAFVHHFTFEFRTGIRDKTLLMMNYLLPLGFYLMMGAVMTEEVNPTFRENMIPAMVTFAALAAALLGLPEPLVNAREKGVFRSYKINGVPATSILIIPALTTMLHLIIVTIIITITAPVLFDAPLPANGLGFALTFLMVAFACTGFGILIGVIAPNSQMTVLFSQLIFLPSMLLGGMMMPYSDLPDGVQKAAQLLPATHAMNAMRELGQGLTANFDPYGSLAVLFISGLLAFSLAVYLFNWDSHNSTGRGHPILALLALLPYAASIVLLA